MCEFHRVSSHSTGPSKWAALTHWSNGSSPIISMLLEDGGDAALKGVAEFTLSLSAGLSVNMWNDIHMNSPARIPVIRIAQDILRSRGLAPQVAQAIFVVLFGLRRERAPRGSFNFLSEVDYTSHDGLERLRESATLARLALRFPLQTRYVAAAEYLLELEKQMRAQDGSAL